MNGPGGSPRPHSVLHLVPPPDPARAAGQRRVAAPGGYPRVCLVCRSGEREGGSGTGCRSVSNSTTLLLQGLWLASAYALEFQSMPMHGAVWLCSCLLFLVHIAIMAILIRGAQKREQRERREEGKKKRKDE